jgi:thioredoxin-like negative regulator of GroEL
VNGTNSGLRSAAACAAGGGKVNADEHRSLGERFGVQGFPTLKWFSRGKAVEKPEE